MKLPFKVTPEKALPICPICNHVGHRPAFCPNSLAGNVKLDNEGEEKPEEPTVISIEENEIDMDKNIDTQHSPEKADKAFLWGERAIYNIVQPLTRKERYDAIKAKQIEEKKLRMHLY